MTAYLVCFLFFLPWELLYVDDLVVSAESEEKLIKKLNTSYLKNRPTFGLP